MRKQITISLALIGVVLAIGITIPALLTMGAKTNQVPLPTPVLVDPVTVTPSLLANMVNPALTPTPDQSQTRSCTYTYDYWKDHPESWSEQVQIAGETITKGEAARLMQAPSKDVTENLQRVLYVTLLNIQAGAERGSIDTTINDASAWLAANPYGTPLSVFNQSIAIAFTQVLEDYNNGLIGPDLCPNQPATPVPTVPESTPSQATTGTLPTLASTQRFRRRVLTPTEPPPTNTPQPPTPTPTRTPTPLPPTATPTHQPPKPINSPATLTPTPKLIPLPPLPTILIPLPSLPLSTEAP